MIFDSGTEVAQGVNEGLYRAAVEAFVAADGIVCAFTRRQNGNHKAQSRARSVAIALHRGVGGISPEIAGKHLGVDTQRFKRLVYSAVDKPAQCYRTHGHALAQRQVDSSLEYLLGRKYAVIHFIFILNFAIET